MKNGVLFGIGAYFLWGLLPIYWKFIHNVPALEIISHRMIWSFIFVVGVIAFSGGWAEFRVSLRGKKDILPFLFTSLLLTGNWLIYVWAVNAGFIVETSLGYFINPLVNVLLGVLFLREKLRPWQWVSVGLAFLGVAYLSWQYGSLPWIALSLAFSFAFYGLIKKKAALSSTQGFATETGIMFFPALAYLLFLEFTGKGAFGHQSLRVTALLILAGVATGLPLLLFGKAARMIPLSMMGFLQYLAPTMQLFIGVFLYHEPFPLDRLIGFGLIWIALLIYSLEGIVSHQKARSATPEMNREMHLPGWLRVKK